MAWSIPTYQGLYALGSPSNYRIAMFELCRAINEREAALGIDNGFSTSFPTKFRKADGTLAANLTMDDLLNIPCVDPSNSYARQNMTTITNWIMQRCVLFTESSGYSPSFTLSTLESAIGATIDYPTRVNEARWWQSVQDALDKLIYSRCKMVVDATLTTGSATSSLASLTPQDTVALAWAQRGYASIGSVNPGGYVFKPADTASGSWFATAGESQRYGFKGSPVEYDGFFASRIFYPQGTITSTQLTYSISASRLASSVDFDIDGHIISASAAAPDTDLSVDVFSFSSDNYVNVVFENPSSSPFEEEDSPLGDTDARTIAISVNSRAKVYFDIAHLLTDQA